MNREIKFRMWNNVKSDPQKSKMFYDLENVFECLKQQMAWDSHDVFTLQYNHVGDGSLFMQFTGLLDKNGKEIYEGDVIKHDLGLERFKKLNWQVVFEFGSFQLRTESEHNPVSFPYHAYQAMINDSILSQSEYCEHLEIIGNIYENPNLIN